MIEVKILMIGNTMSGKTTYMGSAYGLLQNAIYGFTVKCSDTTDHNWLSKIYNSLVASNTYPLATDKRSEYNFKLNFHGTPILDFQWKDFRGGVIDEAGNDTKQLAEDIKESDGIMLFFEADALLNNQSSRTRVRRICSLLSENLESIEKPFFITIVITKFDLVMEKATQDEDIYEKVQMPFKAFQESLEANDNIAVQVAPVSCRKEGLLHVDFPILTMLYGGLYLKYIKGLEVFKADYERLQYLINNSGAMESLWSFFNGVPSNRKLAEDKAVTVNKQVKELEKMQKPIEELKKYIDDYEFFDSVYVINDDIFGL